MSEENKDKSSFRSSFMRSSFSNRKLPKMEEFNNILRHSLIFIHDIDQKRLSKQAYNRLSVKIASNVRSDQRTQSVTSAVNEGNSSSTIQDQPEYKSIASSKGVVSLKSLKKMKEKSVFKIKRKEFDIVLRSKIKNRERLLTLNPFKHC